MKVAIKYGTVDHETLVDADGRISGQDAGPTLVRRLLKIFPGAMVVGPSARRCDGFNMVPLEFVDASDTLVINMDVIDAFAVWQTLYATGKEPRIINFAWRPLTKNEHPVICAALGTALSMFPTFCNSERTAQDVWDIIRNWAPGRSRDTARVSWVNLGIKVERVQERNEPRVPVVLYPAIYLNARKNPALFVEVVEKVAARTEIAVDIRLHQSELASNAAIALSEKPWARVGPLTATKDGYFRALARTTAFLATADEESYGLEYIEALLSGVVGVFPDRPWARALLPAEYPFFYADPSKAEELLYRAVTDTQACRADLDACAGGDLRKWIRDTHDDDGFGRAFAHAVQHWFGS